MASFCFGLLPVCSRKIIKYGLYLSWVILALYILVNLANFDLLKDFKEKNYTKAFAYIPLIGTAKTNSFFNKIGAIGVAVGIVLQAFAQPKRTRIIGSLIVIGSLLTLIAAN